MTTPMTANSSGSGAEARSPGFLAAREWLRKRWHQEWPNEAHCQQLADYAASLSTPSEAKPDQADIERDEFSGMTAGEAIAATAGNDTLMRDLTLVWAALKDRQPAFAVIIDRARARLSPSREAVAGVDR